MNIFPFVSSPSLRLAAPPSVWAVLVALSTWGCLNGSLPADDSKDISKNAIIKHLTGEWEAKGELTAPDGTAYAIKEEWKGVAVSENTFAIEGKREINGDQSDFKWTIILHPDTGVCEATHVINGSEIQRFEGSLSEESRTMELTAQLDGGSTLKLVRVFTGEDYDAFETEVTFANEKGEATVHGKLVTKKVKKA